MASDKNLVRDLLQIANVPYICGANFPVKNYNCVVINLLMVQAGIRPAFMFQPINYMDQKEAQSILNKLIDRFPPDTYKQYWCCQGQIISTNNISAEVQRYSDTNDPVVLGNILGYPCSGEQYNARYACIISAPDGLSVIANMANKRSSVRKFKALFKKMRQFTKTYIGVPLFLEIFKL